MNERSAAEQSEPQQTKVRCGESVTADQGAARVSGWFDAARRQPATWLPGSMLGKLAIEDVYEDFKGPVLFTCVNAAGHRFLVTWALTTPRHDIWLVIAISGTRLQLLQSGAMDLREAFTRSEDATTTRVRVPVRKGRARWRATSACRTPAEWLPEPGVLLCD